MSTLTRATLSANEGGAVSFSVTADIPATATCVYVGWTFDDQGTTVRTFDVKLGGVDMEVVGRKTDAGSGPSFAVYRKLTPVTGAAVSVAVSSTPAFNNRQWRVIVIYVEDGDTSTPNDNAILTELPTATVLNSNSTPSAVDDDVVSFGMVDGRTAATTGPSPAPTTDFGEVNGDGAVYLGATRTDGIAGSVATGWAWGGATTNAAEISFNVRTQSGEGDLNVLIGEPINGSSELE